MMWTRFEGLLTLCRMLIVLSFAFFQIACSTANSFDTGERHTVSLTVVFMDEAQLQAKWTALSGKPAVKLSPRLVLETQKRTEHVLGFYDYVNRTLYSPKMNFEVCGHELHHAVLGPFHYERY
jgi:hypothetical protein